MKLDAGEAVTLEPFDGPVVEGEMAHLGSVGCLDGKAMILDGDEDSGR